MTESVVSYGPGRTEFSFVCGDGNGKTIGTVDIANGILGERVILRPDGSVEAVVRLHRAVERKARPWVDVMHPDGSPLGRMVMGDRYQLEIDGRTVAELHRNARPDLNAGMDVLVDGRPRATLRLRTPQQRDTFVPEVVSQCVMSADPELPPSITAMTSVVPVLLAMREMYSHRTCSVPMDGPSSTGEPSGSWQSDPWHAGDQRWFDGRWWTDQITKAGQPAIDTRVGARSAGSGGGTVLTEPITFWGKEVFDGVHRVVGFVRRVSEEPRHIDILTVGGDLEASLRFDDSHHARHTDGVELLGPDGQRLAGYEVTWKAKHDPTGGQHRFHVSTDFTTGDGRSQAINGRAPRLWATARERNAAIEISGRPRATITGSRVGLRPGKISPEPFDRFDSWLVEVDPTVPSEARRAITALLPMVSLVESRHAKVFSTWDYSGMDSIHTKYK